LDEPQPWVHFTTGKRGEDRAVPLNAMGIEAVKRFVELNAFGAFSESATRNLLLRSIRRVLEHEKTQGERALMPEERKQIETAMVQETRPSSRKRWHFQPYVLRHTCFTELRKRGADLADVQALAGHRHSQTTKRYAPTVNAKLIEAMKRMES
jgi:site-specific recombinase XerD